MTAATPYAAPIPASGRSSSQAWRRWLGLILCATGVPWLVRRIAARRRVTILVYHDPDPGTLARHLHWLSRRFRFVTLDDVAEALETRRWTDLPPYPLVVTVDDGHRGNACLATTFRAYGVRPTIYLCSAIVGTGRPFWWKTATAGRFGAETLKALPDDERRLRLAQGGDDPDRPGRERQALAWEEVRAMTSVADIGAHTRTHPILPRCGEADGRREIAGCRLEIEAALHRPCLHFAYPNGDAGEREQAVTRHAGYRTARSIDPGWNGPTTDPYRLKAMAVSDDAPVAWLAVQAVGLTAVMRKAHPRAWTK
jgi:peptidoglycan/xylan/chitin deacetylase (PgdA/CDA1 family)